MRLPRSIHLLLLSSLTAPGCFSLRRAEHLLEDKDPRAALHQLDERKLKTKTREAALLEAEAALQLSDGARAKEAAQRALAADLKESSEGTQETLFSLAEADLLVGDALSSASLIERALREGYAPPPRLISRLLRLGPRQVRELLTQGKNEQALQVLGAMLAVAPTTTPLTLYAQALFARAQERDQRHEIAGALEDYTTAAPLLPHQTASTAWLAAGGLLLQSKRLAEAEEAFNKSISETDLANGDTTSKTLFIAKLYSDWGEAAHAAELYLSIAQQSKSPYYWNLSGEYFFAAGMLDAAEKAFSLYIQNDLDRASAAKAVAYFFQKKGDPLRWEKYARLAVTMNPTRFRDRETLCNVWFAQGRLDLVKQELDAYIDDVKKSLGSVASAYNEIGFWYVGKKQDELAIVAFESAQKINPSASLDLAFAYGRLRRFTEMRATFDFYLKAKKNERSAKLAVAKHLSNFGDIEAAISLTKDVFTATPAQRDAAFLLADLYLQQKDFAAEEKTLFTYAAANKDTPYAWVEVGRRYLKRDNDRAERALIAAAGKGYTEALLLLGDLYLSTGDKQKAQKAFQQYIDSSSQFTRAINDVLNKYPTSEHEERAKLITQLNTLQPSNPIPFMMLGRESLQLGNLSAAEKAFKGYIQASAPDKTSAYKTVHDLYQTAGYLNQAEDIYLQAIDEYPDNADGLYHKGELSLELDKLDDALAFFERYQATPEKSARNLFQIGELLRKRGVCSSAETFFADSLAIEPAQSDAALSLGRCLLQRGALAQAALVFERAPQLPRVFFEIGAAYREYGYDSLAIPFLKKALFQNPNLTTAEFELSELPELTAALKAAGETEKFAQLADELLALCPRGSGCYGVHISLARAYKDLDQPELRLSHLEKATLLRPGTGSAPSLYEQIAETLLALGEQQRAQDYYQKAANLMPDPAAKLFDYADIAQSAGAIGLAWKLYTLSAGSAHKRQLEAKVAAATLLYQLGETIKATDTLRTIAEEEGTPEIWSRVAKSFLTLREYELAATALQESVSRGAGSSSLELARVLLNLGENQRAKDVLASYQSANPPAREQLEIAALLIELGDTSGALKLYTKLISQNTEAITAFQRASALLIEENARGQLIELSDALLASGADRPRALIEVAKALTKDGQGEEAQKLLQSAAAVTSDERLALEIFDSLLALNKEEEATATLRRFAYQKTNTAMILARAAERAPSKVALELLNEATSLAPAKLELWERAAKLWAAQRSASEASTAFLQALSLSLSPSTYAKEIITSLCENGLYSEAESFLVYLKEPAAISSMRALIVAGKKTDPSKDLSQLVSVSPPKARIEAAKIALNAGFTTTAQQLSQETDLSLSTEALSTWLDASLLQQQYDASALIEKATTNANTFTERLSVLQYLLGRGEATASLSLARALNKERPWEVKTLRLLLQALAATAPSDWEGEALAAAKEFNDRQPLEPIKTLQTTAELLWNVGALSAVQEILAEPPESERLYLLAGKLKLAYGDPSGAQELFGRAIALSTSPAQRWASIGDLYRAVRSYDLAKSAYEEARRLGGQDRALWLKLAEMELLAHNESGATEALREANARSKPTDETFAKFSLAFTELYDNSRGDLEGALARLPESPKKRAALAALTTNDSPEQTAKTPTSETAKLFWEPRAKLWETTFSRWKVSPSNEELLSVWSTNLCAVNDDFVSRCALIVKNTSSSYLIALAAAETSRREGLPELAKLSLHLSPLAGSKPYQQMITSALQHGDKSSASQLANEWRAVALASGVESKSALLLYAITASKPALLRAALLDGSYDVRLLAKKVAPPGTFLPEKQSQ